MGWVGVAVVVVVVVVECFQGLVKGVDGDEQSRAYPPRAGA